MAADLAGWDTFALIESAAEQLDGGDLVTGHAELDYALRDLLDTLLDTELPQAAEHAARALAQVVLGESS